MINRRNFIITATAASVFAGSATTQAEETGMYGLIGKFTAKAGTRDELAAILLDGLSDMPGCLSYIVALDPKDDITLWITEVWDAAESHKASLNLPSVQAAIGRGRPLIEGMDMVATTNPVGGHGLVSAGA